MHRNSFLPPATLAVLVAVGMSGCIGLGGNTPDSLLTLNTAARPAAANAVRSGPIGSALIVLVPTVPQKLRTARIPVQSGDTTLAYLQDAQWVEPPARLFQRLLTETIAAQSNRLVLNESEQVTGPGEALAGELVEFGVDARRNQVVVVYQAVRLQRDGTTVQQQRFEAREAIGAVASAPVAEALNRAANTVAADVAAWLRE